MQVELKVFVSMMSAPAARYASWMPRMMCGCVMESTSLLPRMSEGQSLKRSPRKSGSSSLCFCTMVPMAPSMIMMRRCSSAASHARPSVTPRVKGGKGPAMARVR